jgi:hypothetical protein
MKTLEAAAVILVVSTALLDPWLPILLAAFFLSVMAIGDVKRARLSRAKHVRRA